MARMKYCDRTVKLKANCDEIENEMVPIRQNQIC